MSESRQLILAFIILALCLLGERAWGEEAVLGVRLGLHPDGTTRLVLDLAEPTPFRVGLLAAPNRLYIELPSQGASGELPKGRGLIRRLSLGSATGLVLLTA